MGQADDRIEALRRTLSADPSSADGHGQLGALLLEQARQVQTDAMARAQDASPNAIALYGEALQHAHAARDLRPSSAQAQRLCGAVLREMGELEASQSAFAEAHRLAPHDALVAAEYASSLQAIVATECARRVYEQALREHPEDAGLHAGLALTLLGEGNFGRGWDEYEWRLKVPRAGISRPFPFPTWEGGTLTGRTLFAYSEQGLGDEIMFASCFDELIGLAGHCVLEASYRLAPLFRRSFPRATVVERSLSKPREWSGLPPVDLQIPAGSIPRFLRRQWEAFPNHHGYLKAELGRSLRWHKALENLGPGLKVGLAWTGGLPGTLRAARSLRLEDLMPVLATRGARFVALEFLDAQRELDSLSPAARPAWWPEATRDPDELAGLLSNLDLVISVTTACAHLAGALGRPLWILVPSVPTWRYLWSGDKMPWYPSATVLRRQPTQSQENYVAGLADALSRLVR